VLIRYRLLFLRISWALFVVLAAKGLQAQVENRYSNLRSRVLDAAQPGQLIDSLTVATPLGIIRNFDSGEVLAPSYFTVKQNRLLYDTAQLFKAYPDCKKIALSYRVLPYDFGAKIARLDTVAIRRRINTDAIEFDYSPYEPVKKPWESNGISSAGAYTRGLSFGNSQNLVFNSNLNLQLDGKLGNDLELRAALSDNSIPLQPDGTTRQLQEFDRIFIQLKRKQSTLTAGDYDLTRPSGYFSNYFKRLQGTMAESAFFGKNDSLRMRVAAAVTRGKFARQNIQGQEGNQGPYRLQGTEGERFIIVLAGTEKVYIDGQLLQRGIEDDYVVDYNLGEIVFTPRRLITKDIRIIVEFEYAVQTYLRSTAAFNTDWRRAKSRFYFNLYSEQDARNNGGAQELSPAERQNLAAAGDNLRSAYASGIDTLEAFDPSRVLYRIVDSIVCGAPIPVLIYSTNPDSALYAARFSEVPAGQGHYVLAPTAANGRVFRWSPPDPVTCELTGNFEPVVRLIAPELRQLWTAGTDIQLFKRSSLTAEIAMSNRDYNRFSPLGNNDNLGVASFLRWKQDFEFGKKTTLSGEQESRWRGALNASYEHTARNFQSLNPYRPPEFTRDWNTDNSRDTVMEQIGRAGIFLENKKMGRVQYEFGAFRRQGVYDGGRHFASMLLRKNGWELAAEGNFLKTTGFLEQTQFDRPKIDFSKTFFKKDSTGSQPILKTGLYAEREKNARTAVGADTLSRASFWYDLLRLYFQVPQNQGRWRFAGHVSQRSDFAPRLSNFKRSTIANEFNLNGGWNNDGIRKNYSQSLTWVLSLRRLHIQDSTLSSLEAQNSYLGKADYSFAAWRNALIFTTNYELGSGQSPKLEFNYLQVNPGDGLYTWVDRNRDSILQVDEMEIAVFQDQATYVRVSVTTTEYIRTNNVLFGPSLRFEPRQLWPRPANRTQRLLTRLSTQSNLQINRRTYAGVAGVQAWNPLQLNGLADTSLVTLSAGWRNALFINRADPKWDASIAHGDNRSRLAISTGFEERRNQDISLHGRLNVNRRWSLESDVTQILKASDNQTFNTRDYRIEAFEAGPKLAWLPSRTFRITAAMKWKKSQNTLGEMESATQSNWSAELTWNPASKPNAQGFKASTSLRSKITFADIKYSGQANSVVSFTMLDGLQDGKNFLWSVLLDRQLSKSVQLSLNYEGRKTGENKVVHVGRAQVRALF
jgi:hypothetical protein